MTGKLLKQLEIGEAEPDHNHFAENLMVVGLEYGLFLIEDKFIGTHQLHRTLGLGYRITHIGFPYNRARIWSGVEASLRPARQSSCPGQKRAPKVS